ncbi:MAG TPA: hypothetical protein VKU39_20650 [Streptosporangiaceae bacterium]|nr:hypothetical protein [Streptosporangiaceae bacterium]
MTRVDADIVALKELHAALSRFAYAQREVLARAGGQAEDALTELGERASRLQDERTWRWLHRVDEQFCVYQAAAARFRLLLEEGVPYAQTTLAELITRLEATRATGAAAGPPILGGGVAEDQS